MRIEAAETEHDRLEAERKTLEAALRSPEALQRALEEQYKQLNLWAVRFQPAPQEMQKMIAAQGIKAVMAFSSSQVGVEPRAEVGN